jgi:hypothetical protein
MDPPSSILYSLFLLHMLDAFTAARFLLSLVLPLWRLTLHIRLLLLVGQLAPPHRSLP